MERRTRIAFEAPNFGLNYVDAIADLIAPYLGWKASEKKSSVAQYQDAMARASRAVKNLN
jgi:glycerol-3-phosphate dehydrogenase